MNTDTENKTAADYGQPEWITEPLSPSDVAAINQGGCSSGAYMPAVTYFTAMETMRDHGDDVLQYIEDNLGELPDVPKDTSWAGLNCFYLSCAVELFASSLEDREDWNDEEPIDLND